MERVLIRKVSQKQAVLDSLKRGPRTAKQLENYFGIPKVSAVIAKLREEGHDIENVRIRNSAGKTHNKYVLT
jgi:helix-turn-helix protein